MTEFDKQLSPSRLPPSNDEIIRELKRIIVSGKHWYIALLETIGVWHTVEEIHNGRNYNYLIDGEAFDLLLLTERLCEAMNGLVPGREKTSLLFHNKPPLNLDTGKIREFIGATKYHQCLNFFYGVTVEEGLVLAVQEEIRKERWASGCHVEKDTANETYRRIYGATKTILLRHFRRDKGYSQIKSISLSGIKEFTYWLFKYRLKHCDKARVASDTKKALDWFDRSRYFRQLGKDEFQSGIIDISPFAI
ncbi:hypothetical protein ACFLUJ_03575 [Chloroflexota bacterium]